MTMQAPTQTEINGLNARLEMLKDQHAMWRAALSRLEKDIEDAAVRGRQLDAELGLAECTCETTGFCWPCREVE